MTPIFISVDLIESHSALWHELVEVVVVVVGEIFGFCIQSFATTYDVLVDHSKRHPLNRNRKHLPGAAGHVTATRSEPEQW